MNKKVVLVVGLVALIGILYFSGVFSSKVNYDSFAKCLAGENVTMYGAYWCPHCKEQKSLFGKSAEKLQDYLNDQVTNYNQKIHNEIINMTMGDS